jgi:hypothetical protein
MGLSLYGPGWQSAMARDLGINDRTVRRWVAGQNPVPEWIGDALIEAQKTRMAYLLQQLMCD